MSDEDIRNGGNNRDKMTPEMARDVIRGEIDGRAKSCLAEVNSILAKYNCELAPEVIIRGSKLFTRVIMLPK